MEYDYGNDDAVYYAQAPEHKHSGWGWFWGILAFLAIAAAVVFLILWLTKDVDEKELDITGVQFKTNSSTSVTATWTSVNNDKDQVTMYVYPSGESINFTGNGTPILIPLDSKIAGPVNGNTTKTLTATGLTANVTYLATLIVSNPDIARYHKSVTSPALVPGGGTVTGGAIQINANGQSGETAYELPELLTLDDTNNGTIGYNSTGKSTLNNNHFFLDSDGLLCTVSTSLTSVVNTNPTLKCGEIGGSFVAYDPGSSGPGANQVALKQYQSSDTTNSNAKWKYDPTTQKLCLDSSSSRCWKFRTSTTSSESALTPIDISSDGSGWNFNGWST